MVRGIEMGKKFPCGCVLTILPDSVKYKLCKKHEKLFGKDERKDNKKVKKWLEECSCR